METGTSFIFRHNKFANDMEPMLCKWFEELAVVNEKLQDKNFDVIVNIWPLNVL